MRKVSYLLIIVSLLWSAHAQNPEQSIAPPGMLFELLALNHDLPNAARPTYLSPCDIVASPDGKTLYVAEQTRQANRGRRYCDKISHKNHQAPQ
jgi:hypothetical protein